MKPDTRITAARLYDLIQGFVTLTVLPADSVDAAHIDWLSKILVELSRC